MVSRLEVLRILQDKDGAGLTGGAKRSSLVLVFKLNKISQGRLSTLSGGLTQGPPRGRSRLYRWVNSGSSVARWPEEQLTIENAYSASIVLMSYSALLLALWGNSPE